VPSSEPFCVTVSAGLEEEQPVTAPIIIAVQSPHANTLFLTLKPPFCLMTSA